MRITGTDLLTLDLHANVVTRLDDVAAPSEPAAAIDEADVEEAASAAGPLTLAIDLKDDAAEAAGGDATVTLAA